MTKKEHLIVISAYVVFAAFVSYYCSQWLSLIYFLLIGLFIGFADKFMKSEHSASQSVAMVFVAAVYHNTFYEFFFPTSGEWNKLLSALAAVAFLFGLFTAINPKTQLYGIIAAPVICLMNFRIGFCYGALLLSISILQIYIKKAHGTVKERKKNKKKKRNGQKKEPDWNLLAVVVSVASMVLYAVFVLNPENHAREGISYFLVNFKNNIWAIPVLVYLLVRLLQSDFDVKVPVALGITIFLATAVVGLIFTGWKVFSLAVLSTVIFVAFACLQSEKVVEKIKKDCEKNKLLFLVLALCLLQ